MKTAKVKKLILSTVLAITAGIFLSAGIAYAAMSKVSEYKFPDSYRGQIDIVADNSYVYVQSDYSAGDYRDCIYKIRTSDMTKVDEYIFPDSYRGQAAITADTDYIYVQSDYSAGDYRDCIYKIRKSDMTKVGEYIFPDSYRAQVDIVADSSYIYVQSEYSAGDYRDCIYKIRTSDMTKVGEYILPDSYRDQVAIAADADYVYVQSEYKAGDYRDYIYKIRKSDMTKVGEYKFPDSYRAQVAIVADSSYVYVQSEYTAGDYRDWVYKIRTSDMTKVDDYNFPDSYRGQVAIAADTDYVYVQSEYTAGDYRDWVYKIRKSDMTKVDDYNFPDSYRGQVAIAAYGSYIYVQSNYTAGDYCDYIYKIDTGVRYSLTGYVKYDDNTPAANVRVACSGASSGSDNTDGNGYYEITGRIPGSYTLNPDPFSGFDLPNQSAVITDKNTANNFIAPKYGVAGCSLDYLGRYYQAEAATSWYAVVENNTVIGGANRDGATYYTGEGNWLPVNTKTNFVLNVFGEKAMEGPMDDHYKHPISAFKVRYRVYGNAKVKFKTETWSAEIQTYYTDDRVVLRLDRIDTFQRQSATSILVNSTARTVAAGAEYTEAGWSTTWNPGDHGEGRSHLKIINTTPYYFDVEQEVYEQDEQYDSAYTKIISYAETITMPDWGMTGYVKHGSGAGISGAQVKILDSTQKVIHTVNSGADGLYTAKPLQPGDNYTVNAIYSDYDFDVPAFIFDSNNKQVDLYTYTVNGYITRYNTTPSQGVPGINVNIVGANVNKTMPTDANGFYEFHVRGGTYTVQTTNP